MQGRAGSLDFPVPISVTLAERSAITAAIDPAKSDSKPDPRPERNADAVGIASRDAQAILELL
jgi:hypothetical protein